MDLRWNRIRRRITRELDTQIAEWREASLNKLLGQAWDEYQSALGSGDKLELEAHYNQFVSTALDEVIGLTVEGPGVGK